MPILAKDLDHVHLKPKKEFWDFGAFYNAKKLIILYCDLDSLIELIQTCHDFSDKLILSKINPETSSSTPVTEHTRSRKLQLVLACLLRMRKLNHIELNKKDLAHCYRLSSRVYPQPKLITFVGAKAGSRFLTGINPCRLFFNQSQAIKLYFIDENSVFIPIFSRETIPHFKKNKRELGLLIAHHFSKGAIRNWINDKEWTESAGYRLKILFTIGVSFLSLSIIPWFMTYFPLKLEHVFLASDFFQSILDFIEVTFNQVFGFPWRLSSLFLFLGMCFNNNWLKIGLCGLILIGLEFHVLFFGCALYFFQYLLFLYPLMHMAVYCGDNTFEYLWSFYLLSCFIPVLLPSPLTSFICTAFFLFWNVVMSWCAANAFIFLGMYDLLKTILLSFPVTFAFSIIALPLSTLIYISTQALLGVALVTLAVTYASLFSIIYPLDQFRGTSAHQVLNLHFRMGYQKIVELSSSVIAIFPMTRKFLFPKIDWDPLLEKELSLYSEDTPLRSMLNFARMIVKAEITTKKELTPQEQVTFLIKDHLNKNTGLGFFRKKDTTEISFLRSLDPHLSIEEIDYKMEKYKNNHSVTKEFESIYQYVKYVLFPMEEMKQFCKDPSLKSLWEVPYHLYDEFDKKIVNKMISSGISP